MLFAAPALADPLRVATWHGDFSRKGPGLLLKELLSDKAPDLGVVTDLSPDVLVLTDIDYDAGLVALGALADKLGGYPHLFALRPNTGMPTGLDLDGDGRLGGPRDAQGYGWFSGQGGMAILSRYPLKLVADHTALLWKDAPDTLWTRQEAEVQRLSTGAHWAVRVDAPQPFTLLTLAATPPVFDGPEDRNGRRNHDEVLLWTHELNKGIAGPVVLAGLLNLDPERGEGLREAARNLLDIPHLQDPLPHLPTVEWDKVGEMRVSYVLPDSALKVLDAGVTPVPGPGPHRVVWVDLSMP